MQANPAQLSAVCCMLTITCPFIMLFKNGYPGERLIEMLIGVCIILTVITVTLWMYIYDNRRGHDQHDMFRDQIKSLISSCLIITVTVMAMFGFGS